MAVATVARYHRGAAPKKSHEDYGRLDRALRRRIKRLAAILRVADGFDRGHAGAVARIKVRWLGRAMRLTAVPANSEAAAPPRALGREPQGARCSRRWPASTSRSWRPTVRSWRRTTTEREISSRLVRHRRFAHLQRRTRRRDRCGLRRPAPKSRAARSGAPIAPARVPDAAGGTSPSERRSHAQRLSLRQVSSSASRRGCSAGSSTGTTASTRRSKLRGIQSAEPM